MEAHPAISTAIGERLSHRCRIPGRICPIRYRRTGWIDPPVAVGRSRGSERMLLEYFRDFLRGIIDQGALRQALEYWQTITSEKKQPLLHRERHLLNVKEEFRSLRH